MSDFIFYRNNLGIDDHQLANQTLKQMLGDIPPSLGCGVLEFSGHWGTLLVREGHYAGFLPVETDDHLIAVLGGPVLNFADNSFLANADSSAGSIQILERWRSGTLEPHNDLDGPFHIFIVDKANAVCTAITDLMSFIPVFGYHSEQSVVIGSHVDISATAAKLTENGMDEVCAEDSASIADFTLHGAVCYPFTLYQSLYQLPPAYELNFVPQQETLSSGANGFEHYGEAYWRPQPKDSFKNIEQAANFVRKGISDYVGKILAANNEQQVAQFISAGEDSRVIAGLLREIEPNKAIEAQVYTDTFNKELKIAKSAAKKYGLNFKPIIRKPNHYFDILAEASRLTGSQFQYHHSHPFRVQDDSVLLNFGAVFGGFSADVLLKGQYVPKRKVQERLRFMPEVEAPSSLKVNVKTATFAPVIVAEISQRRELHANRVNLMRGRADQEWAAIWPATMRKALPNLIANRRLFRSYEPFVSNTVVFAAVSTPVVWRLNRRLFYRAFKPVLRLAKLLRHPDGRLPYFPWWVNAPSYTLTSYRRAWLRRFRKSRIPQGPWCNWHRLKTLPEWTEKLADTEIILKEKGFIGKDVKLNVLGYEQQLNLMQLTEVLYRQGI